MASSSSDWKPVLYRKPRIWLHGTSKTFDQFKARSSPQDEFGFGVHFTKNTDLANLYSGHHTSGKHSGKYPQVRMAELSPKKIFSANRMYNKSRPEFGVVVDALSGSKRSNSSIRSHIRSGLVHGAWLGVAHPKKALSALQKRGYDAVLYENKAVETGGQLGTYRLLGKAKSISIIDPKAIKY